MRKMAALLLFFCLPFTGGCALADLMFSVFGGSYSAGGNTDAARRQHYEDRVSSMTEPPRIPGTDTRPF